MNNKVILNEIIVNYNKVIYKYSVYGSIKRYLKKNEYYLEYAFSLENIPKSILTVPFVANLLPLIWITDSELVIDEIDQDFFDSIDDFKKGYQMMKKNITFKGNIICSNIICNKKKTTGKIGAFFSGGIDATSTLVSNIKDISILINIQGSDIDLNDKKTIHNMKIKLDDISRSFDKEITYIKSSFRKIFNYRIIDFCYKKVLKDDYWHSLQHGIAIISHGAPIAYYYNLDKLLIAASYSIDNPAKSCASDPSIDNYVKFCDTKIIHDGYDKNRGMKIINIGEYLNKNHKKVNIRVCFDENRADNCCNCEKCYRTITEILGNNLKPEIFGFNIELDKYSKKLKHDLDNKIFYGNAISLWKNIKKNMIQNDYNGDLEWLKDYNFDKDKNIIIKYFNKINHAIIKRINKYILRRK